MPPDFPGFRARVAFFRHGVWPWGHAEARGFTPRVELLEDVRNEVERELASLLGHRRPVPFSEGEGRYPMRLVEEGPLGTGILLEDPYRSRIWVQQGRLTLVERHLPQGSFRIHLEDWTVVEKERLLPHRFLVVRRDGAGRILRVERYRDTYQRVGPYWLPQEREVVAEGEEMEAMVLRLEEMEVVA
ncbi:MAG: DUF3386 family protein [Thermus sp.]